jgi:hypothetical protein
MSNRVEEILTQDLTLGLPAEQRLQQLGQRQAVRLDPLIRKRKLRREMRQ